MDVSDPAPTVKPVDLKQIADVLRHHLRERAHRFVPIATYTDAVVIEVHLSGRSVVFKGHYPQAADTSRIVLEAWACDRAREAGVPAPRILAVDASGTRFPAPYFLMERVRGRRLAVDEHTPDQLRKLVCEGGQLIRRFHQVQLHGYGPLDDAHFRLTGEVRGEMETWHDAVLGAVQQALEYLSGNELLSSNLIESIARLAAVYGDVVAGWSSNSLLNGDLGLGNFFTCDGTITGVIDWGERAAGDPIWDLIAFDWKPSQELRWLLEGYEPDVPVREILDVRLPLYAALQAVPWAAWCHRRGHRRPLRVLEHVARRGLVLLGM